MTKCSNCKKELVDNHAFCPNCGYDLRKHSQSNEVSVEQKIQKIRPSFTDKLGTPNGSIWISFIIGVIIMEMRNGFYRYLTTQDANVGSLLGSILGAGAGFLIAALIPGSIVSLIVYAIKKKFPKDVFTALVYVFTGILSILFLATPA